MKLMKPVMVEMGFRFDESCSSGGASARRLTSAEMDADFSLALHADGLLLSNTWNNFAALVSISPWVINIPSQDK